MTERTRVSPFHEGEREMQTRLGVRDRVERIGQQYIRDYLPDQHREFYQQLPFLLIGSVDTQGRPWASILVGRNGFIRTPDEHTLSINTPRIHGDPLHGNIATGSAVGVLGIQYALRRRNRLTAKVTGISDESIVLRVDQTFGNCPQYIQAREAEFLPEIDNVGAKRPSKSLQRLSEQAKAMIANADHFYIATYFSEDANDVSHGADVSHRGGKPGFVRIEDERTLSFPDFTGNYHFNTLGNIAKNPRAGLLFIDFEAGDLLYLTGAAEIIWDSAEKRAFDGAERLLRLTLDEGLLIEQAMPMRWTFVDYSPILDKTGSWQEVEESIVSGKQQNLFCNYRVTRVERESSVISSYYLEPEHTDTIRCHKAGQFLPIEIRPPGYDKAIKRTYTLSNAPNGTYYRLSIKREPAAGPDLPAGAASAYFHDHIRPGSIVKALAPRSRFVLQESSTRPVVLLSAGVGITPMISMLEQLAKEAQGCGCDRKVWFIHGARNGNEHAFADYVRSIAARWPCLSTHFVYSAPQKNDVAGEHYDSAGRIDIELVKKLLPLDDYDFYCCGPIPFMQTLYKGLKGLNVGDDRIHYEFFGPGVTLLKENPAHNPTHNIGLVGDFDNTEMVKVRFADSGKTAIWDPSQGTLLDLAESAGLQPMYSCRSGICGTCETRVSSGQIAYTDPPLAEPQPGHALICCGYPSKQTQSLILDI